MLVCSFFIYELLNGSKVMFNLSLFSFFTFSFSAIAMITLPSSLTKQCEIKSCVPYNNFN
jgi:hypothetical protein